MVKEEKKRNTLVNQIRIHRFLEGNQIRIHHFLEGAISL